MERESFLRKPSASGVFYTFGTIMITILALIYFDGIIKPFIVAVFFWFIIKELKRLIGKITIKGKSLSRWWQGFFAIILVLIVIFGAFELISINIEQVNNVAPEYREKMDDLVNRLSKYVNDPQIMGYLKDAVSKINIAKLATDLVNSISSLLGNFVVVLIYLIFLLMEEAAATKKIGVLFPVKKEKYKEFTGIVEKVDSAVRSYLSSMILISFLTALISYVALLIIGVDFPVLWAFLIFILNFVPYIGPFISSFLPALLSVFQFGDLLHFVYVFVVLEVIQVILGNFVQPKMMGKSLNISALAVLVTLAFWGSIWGIVGMILAVPITSIIIIFMWQFPNTKWLAIILSENGDFGDNNSDNK